MRDFLRFDPIARAIQRLLRLRATTRHRTQSANTEFGNLEDLRVLTTDSADLRGYPSFTTNLVVSQLPLDTDQ